MPGPRRKSSRRSLRATASARVGILGGSFDPVHAGHLAMARAARSALGLDLVLFVPARLSPLKRRRPAPARHRLAMLRLALRRLPRARIEGMELRRRGPSYTVDTLRALKRRWPKAGFFLLLGADAARDLPRWRRAAEVRRLAVLAAFPRPGFRIPKGMLALPMVPRAVSATAFREVLARGRSPAGCPSAVAAYARKHRLYATRRV